MHFIDEDWVCVGHIHFIDEDWVFNHIIVGLFEAPNISNMDWTSWFFIGQVSTHQQDYHFHQRH